MADNTDKISHLADRLEVLTRKQDNFLREIKSLRDDINAVKAEQTRSWAEEKAEVKAEIRAEDVVADKVLERPVYRTQTPSKPPVIEAPRYSSPTAQPLERETKSDLEKFIGENLINKIGIAITIIGVAIGAKYSIEHQLISPLTRIILGYLVGIGLLGFGMKLKQKYENYSAVLVSGAIAIMYFITYSAYSFYGLFPQGVAFALMVVFTGFGVVAAINYNKQVIAHIGLVGAYAVPFMLSDGSGKVAVLFSYMAIINVGILLIAFKKYWKPIYYSSFVLTWLIFFSWFATVAQPIDYFGVSLVFLFIFFATFYAIFLAYKLLQHENFGVSDIVLLLTNAFVFYGLGYSILNNHPVGTQLLGVFTLVNALVHFGISVLIYKQKLADKNLFYLVAGLVLVFITIAIPVQLDGHWVTLLWAFEAALLFWIGRTKAVAAYELLSYPLMLLAFLSLADDWGAISNGYYPALSAFRTTPLFNINFLSCVLFLVAFGFINRISNDKRYTSQVTRFQEIVQMVNFALPVVFIIVLYGSFLMEILTYFNRLYVDSGIATAKTGDFAEHVWNNDIMNFQLCWTVNYTFLFFVVLSFVNIKRFKNRNLGLLNLGVNAFAVVFFLTQGLYALGYLKESYIGQPLSEYYEHGVFNIGIRYISFAFLGLMLYAIYNYLQQDFLYPVFRKIELAFDSLLNVSVLIVLSSELITWLGLLNAATQTIQLGLSILWGIYALGLIAWGIRKKKKHLRVGGIGLFGVTLLKLFLSDIASLDTIAKTVVFVSLGILLLIISFLYNKYKYLIADENED